METLMQKQAAVDMLRAMVRCGRAKQSELDLAEIQLAEMKQQTETGPAQPQVNRPPASRPASYTAPVVAGVLPRTTAIMRDIDSRQRALAELSNELHSIPQDVSCPALVAQILATKNEIEDLWTQKRLIERNRQEEIVEVAKSDPEDEKLLIQLMYERQRLTDKRSKLRKKLQDPRRSLAKNSEWEQELAKIEVELNVKDTEIQLLRTRL